MNNFDVFDILYRVREAVAIWELTTNSNLYTSTSADVAFLSFVILAENLVLAFILKTIGTQVSHSKLKSEVLTNKIHTNKTSITTISPNLYRQPEFPHAHAP